MSVAVQVRRALGCSAQCLWPSRSLFPWFAGTNHRLFGELLTNMRKTECGADVFLVRLAVRATPFALLTHVTSRLLSAPVQTGVKL